MGCQRVGRNFRPAAICTVLISPKSSPRDFSASFDPSRWAGSRAIRSRLSKRDATASGEQSRWRSYQRRPTRTPGEMNEDELPVLVRRPQDRRGERRPTRIRTSSLTNGRWRLNQSGEIWLSRASATHHVAWPRYLCASTRSRFWIRAVRAKRREATHSASSNPVIPLASCRLFSLPLCRESIC